MDSIAQFPDNPIIQEAPDFWIISGMGFVWVSFFLEGPNATSKSHFIFAQRLVKGVCERLPWDGDVMNFTNATEPNGLDSKMFL